MSESGRMGPVTPMKKMSLMLLIALPAFSLVTGQEVNGPVEVSAVDASAVELSPVEPTAVEPSAVETSPVAVYRLVTEDLLSREDFMMYRTDEVRAVHYAEVCTAFGAARMAGDLGDDQMLSRLSERYLRVINEPVENTANHVDANVYGILPLELYRQTGNQLFYDQGIALADGQWKDTLPGGLTAQTRYWIDDVWMIGSLQTEAYRVTGDTAYLNRAARETVAYLEKLQQPNGLFHHGPDAPFFWGRGNGWVAAGLAEVISGLPETHPLYPPVLEGYEKMMQALLEYQTADGMWRQLIDVDSAWEESSCTGMFGYAIAVGVRRGILEASLYGPSYEKAWKALTDHLSEDGRISGVCVGTGQSTRMEYYLNRPTVTGDFHGQAPLLWMAWCMIRD